MPRLRPSAFHALIAIALAALVSVSGFGTQHLIQNNNEGLYAQVAREMLEHHSWIVPTLNGVPYIEKPPLLYWLTAFSFALFGNTEGAARMAPALGFALTLAALATFGRRWWDARTGVIAAAIGLSCPLLLGMSRILMFDLLFTAFYTWAVFSLYEAVSRDKGAGWLRLSYASLALAVLTKGLVALAFFAPLAAGLVVACRDGRRARLRRLLDPVGIALFLVIAVPWHVAASLREPGFAWFYFVNEHVLRFLDLREPHDYYHGAWWYYIPRIAAACGPWLLVFLLPRAQEPDAAAQRRWLWATFLVPLVFFSISAAKANYYMVVALPSLALLMADRVARAPPRALAVVPVAWILLAGCAAAWAPRMVGAYRLPDSTQALLIATLCIAAASGILFMLARPLSGAICCAVVAAPLSLFMSAYLDANEDLESGRRAALAIRESGAKHVYAYRDYETLSSMAYYLGKPIGIIDPASNDLLYGIRSRADAAHFPSGAEFARRASTEPLVIVSTEYRRGSLEKSALARQLALIRTIGRTHLYLWKPDRASAAGVAQHRDGDAQNAVSARALGDSLQKRAAAQNNPSIASPAGG